MDPEKNKFFNIAIKKAQVLLKDNKRVQELLGKALSKSSELKGNQKDLSTLERLKVLIKMLRAYISGNYRKIPAKSLIRLCAALVYFVMPLDFIPDFIPITGFIDDFTVVLWVWNGLQDDIREFQEWQRGMEPKKI